MRITNLTSQAGRILSYTALCLLLAGLYSCGGDINHLTFKQKKFTELTGLVKSGGQPLSGAGVIIRTQGADVSPMVWQGHTVAGGSYSIKVEWFPFTDYYVLVTHPSRSNAPVEGADYDRKVLAWEYLAKKDVGEIEIALSAGTNTLSGLVLLDTSSPLDGIGDTPLPGVTLKVDDAHTATSNASGQFILTGLPDGEVTLAATMPDSTPAYVFTPSPVKITLPQTAVLTIVAQPGT